MNISITEEIISYINFIRTRIDALLKYTKAYQGYPYVILHKATNKFPFEATLKDGTRVELVSPFNVWYYTRIHGMSGIEHDQANNIVTISGLPYLADHNTKLKFYNGARAGDIPDIFFGEEYKFLQVKGKTVVDVGASIADSSIYFATKGAKKVISLEPFPKVYEIAKKNIELNNLTNRITLLLAACGRDLGQITIDPEFDSEFDIQLHEFNQGIQIPLLTLESISKENNLQKEESVLKMDCEGCEYESILSASEGTLQNFSHIMIEYHYGYKNLKQKLEKSNFNVYITPPNASGKYARVGFLYARNLAYSSST